MTYWDAIWAVPAGIVALVTSPTFVGAVGFLFTIISLSVIVVSVIVATTVTWAKGEITWRGWLPVTLVALIVLWLSVSGMIYAGANT